MLTFDREHVPNFLLEQLTVSAFDAGTKVQLHGTPVRSRRKLGHTTVMGDDVGEA